MNSLIFSRHKLFRAIKLSRWSRLFIFLTLPSLFLMGCQLARGPMPSFDESANLSGNQEQVVLLHGMWRDANAMKQIEHFFIDNGYKVSSLSYPSNDHDVETLVENFLHPQIQEIQANHQGKIHFVTHSMGGILVRYYLKNYEIDVGRVVMIAPPNHGSELTDVFEDSKWVTNLTGPAGSQLSTAEDSWVNRLGAVDFELGVVAGNYNTNWITAWLLPGQDDGVVTIENTKVEGMKDFLVVPEKHYKMRRAKIVMQQAAYFLKNGNFYQAYESL